ncbi:MAG: hypothetical protein Tsb0034_00290 [Ekhidna sp.]
MEDHLERFERGQTFLGFGRKISKDEIKEAIAGLQEWNGFESSTFRLMLIADGNESGQLLDSLFYITNTDIANHETPPMASLITHEYLREYPEIKSINYLTSNLLHSKKAKANAIDVLYHRNGQVSEASRSNVFMVKDGVLITPSRNILHGITRKNVLKFSSDLMETQVRDVSLKEVMNADEVFLTSTLKEVLPIVQIDKKKIGSGQIGRYTLKIQRRFLDHLYR